MDVKDEFELQKINNIENPYVVIDDSKYSDFDEKNYSYGVVDDLTHNNMQPEFRKKNYGVDYQPMINTFQRKTDLFTGSKNNLDWRPKKEVEALFKPAMNNNYIHGAPVQTDLYKSRFIPSMKRDGEKPFQEIRVQPGLNLGYNEDSNVGFHDDYRVIPRTTNQIRTLNNPKLTYSTPTIPGLKASLGPEHYDNINKKKPEKFRALGTYQIVPNRAYITAPSIYGRTNPLNLAKTENRGTHKTDTMASGAYLPTNQKVINGEVQSLRQNFKQDSPTNLSGSKLNQIYNIIKPEYTNRDLYKYSSEETGNIGISNNSISYIYDKYGMTPYITKRDLYKFEDLGNIGNNDTNKSYIYDVNGTIPEITLRDIYKYEKFGNIGSIDTNKSYIYDTEGTTSEITLRDIYKIKDLGNIGLNDLNKSYIYDEKGMMPDTTLRDIYKFDDKGNIGGIDTNKSYVYDTKGTVPELTNRDLYKYKDNGNVGNKDINKSYVYDTKGTVPELTNRDLYKFKDNGNLGVNEFNKSYIYDTKGTTPNITNRDLYKFKDIGHIGAQDINKSYIFDNKGMTPEFTNRDMYKNKEIYKPANASSEYKQRPRLDIDNSHINDTKQNINLTYRIPTLSNYSKTPANNGSKQHLKKPLENKLRFNPPNYQNEIINDKLCSSLNNPITDNNVKQTSRLNDYIIQNLNNNPYINNVIHKSTIN